MRKEVVGFGDIRGDAWAAGMSRYWLAAAFLAGFLLAGPARAEVELPTGLFYLNVQELPVKVLGGYVNVTRTWYRGRWYFGREWAALEPEYDDDTAQIRRIVRNGQQYLPRDGDSEVFELDTHHSITLTPTGFRWRRLDESYIDYDANGLIVAYGDRNDVRVTFDFEAGELVRVRDHHGNVALTFHYHEGRVSRIVDPEGREVSYLYTPEGRLRQVNDVLGNPWLYEYDINGRIKTRIDAEGRRETITYYQSGRVRTVNDSSGESTRYEYARDTTQDQLYVKVTAPGGLVTEEWFDHTGLMVRSARNGRDVLTMLKDGRRRIVVDSSGHRTVEEYNEWEQLTRITHPDGSSRSFIYIPSTSRIREMISERGARTTFEYDSVGNLILRTDALGLPEERVTKFEFDPDGTGQTDAISRLADENTQLAVVSFEYDQYGNPETVTDAEGYVSTYTYDRMGNPLTFTDARQKLWTYQYDDAGRLRFSTYPGEGPAAERTTERRYDKVGNLKRVIAPDLTETGFEYDPNNRLVLTTNGAGGRNMRTYNSDGLLVAEIDPEGVRVTTHYDSEGRRIEVDDGTGNPVRYEYQLDHAGDQGLPWRIRYPRFDVERTYDTRLRVTREVYRPSLGPALVTTMKYDAAGNTIEVTDPKQRTAQTFYDAFDRPVRMVDPAGGETQFTYDDRDNILTLTDAKQNTTTMIYDREDRRRKVIQPLTAENSWLYGPTGLLVERLDEKGQRIAYEYDDAGTLRFERQFETDTPTTPIRSIEYTYDVVGNLKTWDDGTYSGTYNYDAVGRKLSQIIDYETFTLASGYTYYLNGQIETYTRPGGEVLTYRYDEAGRLQSVLVSGEGSITYDSYDWHSPASISLPGGGRRTFEYDAFYRLLETEYRDPARNRPFYQIYEYDDVSNLVSRITEHGEYTYDYDNLDRLIEDIAPGADLNSYEYDEAGNRRRFNGGAEWEYNANNQLVGHDSFTYQYDENGNLRRKDGAAGTTHYEYDVHNRLVSVLDDSMVVVGTYEYFPSGLRSSRTEGGVQTFYHYSDEGLEGEYDENGVAVRRFGYSGRGIWQSDPLYVQQDGIVAYYLNDVIGTPQKAVFGNGTEGWAARYEAFGAATTTGILQSPLRFAGQTADELTALHYNYHRFYDPSSGRYISPDPLGMEGGFNSYLYALNNPLTLVDETGERPIGWLVRLTANGMKKVARVTREEAIRLRRRGHNILADRRQVAAGIERAAQRGQKILKHDGHRLPDGSRGRPHYQARAWDRLGHTFWSVVGAGMVVVGGTVSNVAEAAETVWQCVEEYADYFDPFTYITSGPREPPPGFVQGPFGFWKKVE